MKSIVLQELSPSSEVSPSGTVLIVHGLNIAPHVMFAFGREFSARGKKVFVMSLTGHRGDHSEVGCVSAAQWKRDVEDALCMIQHGPQPVAVLGYSLGGLLATAVLHERTWPSVDRLLLLAPAIGLRPWVRCGEVLAQAMPSWFPLLSGVPARYRATRLVHSHWYRALFEVYHEVQNYTSALSLKDVDVRVFLSRKDEFIGWRETEQWCRALNFSALRLLEIKSQSKDCLIPNHLVVDEGCLGRAAWQRLIEDMMSPRQ